MVRNRQLGKSGPLTVLASRSPQMMRWGETGAVKGNDRNQKETVRKSWYTWLLSAFQPCPAVFQPCQLQIDVLGHSGLLDRAQFRSCGGLCTLNSLPSPHGSKWTFLRMGDLWLKILRWKVSQFNRSCLPTLGSDRCSWQINDEEQTGK